MCPRTTEPARISVELEEALGFFHETAENMIREVVRVLGVNETDRRALEIVLLEEEKSTTPGMLAERLGLTSAGVTIMLNRLEKQGYIVRSLHPTDRRRVIVMATEVADHRVRETVVPMIVETYKTLLSWYDSAELETIADFLTRVGELQRAHWQRLRDRAPYSKPEIPKMS
ncbi:putative transcriptional regulator, MarR family [Nocardia nova SH22a]|uniref:Putative transcriptional regulator, MarR family n=1 Tax=Nocardia nova SH22a TaxID=1415166 RepID=W5TCC1_9NOCA|nr:putative transcriptional regulator, MarR family [Nocardia nova SH22a]